MSGTLTFAHDSGHVWLVDTGSLVGHYENIKGVCGQVQGQFFSNEVSGAPVPKENSCRSRVKAANRSCSIYVCEGYI